jgi:hypothetical protein
MVCVDELVGDDDVVRRVDRLVAWRAVRESAPGLARSADNSAARMRLAILDACLRALCANATAAATTGSWLLSADNRLSAEARRRVGGAAVAVMWTLWRESALSVSGDADGQRVEVVGQDRSARPGLLAVIAFSAAP